MLDQPRPFSEALGGPKIAQNITKMAQNITMTPNVLTWPQMTLKHFPSVCYMILCHVHRWVVFLGSNSGGGRRHPQLTSFRDSCAQLQCHLWRCAWESQWCFQIEVRAKIHQRDLVWEDLSLVWVVVGFRCKITIQRAVFWNGNYRGQFLIPPTASGWWYLVSGGFARGVRSEVSWNWTRAP